nr:integrase, catalytic region, zinc finger, CCHC-type, peptidase aspartic, catalytic [Tanacetum cinerariifolium]
MTYWVTWRGLHDYNILEYSSSASLYDVYDLLDTAYWMEVMLLLNADQSIIYGVSADVDTTYSSKSSLTHRLHNVKISIRAKQSKGKPSETHDLGVGIRAHGMIRSCCVSSDTCPLMLDWFDFESLQQRIRLYYLGKENRENILKSIDEGPFKMGKFRETLAEGALHLGLERDRVFADLIPKEKERFKADIRATNILLQGLPKDIYTLINHYTNAKDIWDKV